MVRQSGLIQNRGAGQMLNILPSAVEIPVEVERCPVRDAAILLYVIQSQKND